ncbi:MAG: ribosome silencing factor [Spirochaetales bacterium]|nr:ribosome silencing factor [Spirochaetales bacterium]
MADIVRNKTIVEKLAHMLEDHKGEDTIILDVRERCDWTDFFIITTVRSQAHLNGLLRHLYQFFNENGIQPLKKRKGNVDMDWVLIDCGDFVVHFMNEELREFYDLEKLWFGSRVMHQSS